MRRNRISRSLDGAQRGGLPFASGVSITGTLLQGSGLTGNYVYNNNNFGPEGVSTFRWLRNGSPIGGATAKTYTLVSGDLNANIQFEVTVKSGLYTAPPVTSPAVGPIRSVPVASVVVMNGNNSVGSVRTGGYSYANADGSAESGSTFVWQRADNGSGLNAVTVATTLAYDLTTDDYQKFMRFTVTPRSANAIVGSAVSSSWTQVTTAPMFAVAYNTNRLRMFMRDKTKFATIGNEVTLSVSAIQICRLTATKVAIRASTGANIAVYAFDGTNWAQEGSTYSVGFNFTSPLGLADNRIVIRNTTASPQVLRVMDWNGTTFTNVGNTLNTVDGMSGQRRSNSIFTLGNSITKLIGSYAFDGTNIELVGNELNLSPNNINATGTISGLVASIVDLVNSTIKAYLFTPPNWAQVGNTFSISGLGFTNSQCGFSGWMPGVVNHAGSQLRFLSWDGTNFANPGGVLAVAGDIPFGTCNMVDPGS